MKELDDLTAPTPTYPGWFQEKTLDQPVADALRESERIGANSSK